MIGEIYISSARVRAIHMSRLDYNTLRGWQMPIDECGDDEGYLIERLGAKPNTPEFAGCVSWMPTELFDQEFTLASQLSFGDAIEAMKKGARVARHGWNGKEMFLFLVPGSTFKVHRAPLLGIYEEGTEINYCPYIDMKTADGSIVPWLASQTDILSDDWTILIN